MDDDDAKMKEREHKRRLEELARIRKQQREVEKKLKQEVSLFVEIDFKIL